MKNSSLKLALAAGVLAVASMSQAITFVATSVGNYVVLGPAFSTTEIVSVSTTAPYAAVTNLSLNGTMVANSLSGTATYTTSTLGENLVLAFNGPAFSNGPLVSSISGTWSFVSGAGSYSNVASGSGTWSATYVAPGTLAFTTFAGDLQPVPEPASMAVLGLGAAALLRRRRK